MGKRVFEVAKELGVDHRELLNKCDELRINVRNYMSELKGADLEKLRSAMSTGSGPVEERIEAPGVVRRRRNPRAESNDAERPAPAKDKSAAARAAVRPAAPPPAEKPAAPVVAAVEPAAVVVSQAEPPAVQAEPPVEKPAAAEPAAVRPTSERAQVLSRPERRKVEPNRARVLSRPDAPVVAAPKPKEPKKPVVPQGPVGDAISRRMKHLRPAHETLLRRKPEPEPEVEVPAAPTPEAVVEAPAKVEAKAADSKPEASAAVPEAAVPAAAAVEAPAPEAVAASAGDADGSAEDENRPREEKLAPSVTRRTAKKPDKAVSAVRAPQARPKAAAVAGAGQAKILGTIPLEQLQRRTRQPARRGGPAAGPGARGPAPRGRPGGPPGAGAAPASRFGGGPPVPPAMPGADKGGERRRRGAPARAGEAERRPRAGAGGGAGGDSRGRKRVFNRDDIYKGGAAGSRLGRGRRRKMSSRRGAKTQLTTPAAHKRVVKVNGTISVSELGKQLGVKANDLIRQLMGMGMMATLNQQLDMDTVTLIAGEFDYEARDVSFDELAMLSGPAEQKLVEEDPDAVLRAPVVTIMGHVDHGKTTLLDRIRSANVASGEAGGITQHMGAYRVETSQGPVVFLDTPGHAAFTAMRARGASVTDLVVLVVAADDGVMPQTAESIAHARAAGVPLIVAINKIDKPGVDPERIKQELTKFELVPEEWGGETMMLPVSALRGDGVDGLLEALALQAEVLELKANPKKDAFGRVVEARVEKGRGTVATVLVQEGTLSVGDYMVAGEFYGRVRAIMDSHGKRLKTSGPSTPVEVLGLGGLPTAGDAFYTAKTEKDAKKVAAHRESEVKRAAATGRQTSGVDLLAQMGQKEREKQNLILKADVSGSLEALKGSLEQLATDEVEARLVHTGVGVISVSDIDLAAASDSVVIGFNCDPDSKAKRAADQAGVTILKFSVIYDVLDTVKELMSGLLTPETVEVQLGKAEVRAVFHIQKVGTVAGCIVTDGKVLRGAIGRVYRNGSLLVEGKITTLKRFKDDVREVANGYECGVAVDGYKDAQEGDRIEIVELKLVKRTID